MSGLIYAEAYGINSGNVSAKAAGDDVKAKRLLGTEGTIGQETLGLSETFMQDVINAVGNYTARSTTATSAPTASTCLAKADETLSGQTLLAATAPRAARSTQHLCARTRSNRPTKKGDAIASPFLFAHRLAFRHPRQRVKLHQSRQWHDAITRPQQCRASYIPAAFPSGETSSSSSGSYRSSQPSSSSPSSPASSSTSLTKSKTAKSPSASAS